MLNVLTYKILSAGPLGYFDGGRRGAVAVVLMWRRLPGPRAPGVPRPPARHVLDPALGGHGGSSGPLVVSPQFLGQPDQDWLHPPSPGPGHQVWSITCCWTRPGDLTNSFNTIVFVRL